MTGMGVERFARAAYPLPSVSPAAASAPLPPHIQGAERRRSRWGLRLLVIGGLAGAAWLLTGAAAHAADRADEPDGSLLGAVIDGDATAPVTGLLTAAAQPPEAVPAHRHHVVADILDVPHRVLTRPVEAISEVTHGHTGTTVDTTVGGVATVLREVAGPLRLTGGPDLAPQRIIATVTDAVVAVPDARPAGDGPQRPAVAPAQRPTEPTAQEGHGSTVPSAGPGAGSGPAPQGLGFSTPSAEPGVGSGTAHAVLRHAKAASHHLTHRGAARTAVTDWDTADEEWPSGDGPSGDGPAAPLQLHLGDVSGTPTTGSGTRTEGGSAAFLPAAIVSSAMACHPLPIVSDVEVRRHDAEAPTVSPD
ncbi:hypothetical protein ACIA5D_24595 [Actinoplanes sp. NPDC051513]|uniref:hypothetical protein n=1 Tax=Actinoplanes sp. NPDC051513 TaxID=3363908 RepID=UPI00378DAB03